MSYITKNGLKGIFKKLQEKFFFKSEAQRFCGYTYSEIKGANNNISIGSNELLISNHIYEMPFVNKDISIIFPTVTDVNSGDSISYINYFYGKNSTPKFQFPSTYNINFPEDLFILNDTGNEKIIEAIGELNYYILKVVIADNKVFLDIDAKISLTNYYIRVKLNNSNTSVEKPFINMGWYYRNKNYINSIQYTTMDSPGINDWNEYRNIENDNGIVSSNWKYVKIYLYKNCKSLSQMFKNCRISLLDLSSKPEAITDFSYMCQDSDLEGFLEYETYINMPDYVNCTGMFKNCISLRGINKVGQKEWVRDYVTWVNTNMSASINILNIILRINWGKDPIWDSMFEECSNLLFVDMSDWVIQKDSKISAGKMFYNSFKQVYFGDDTYDLNYPHINYVKFPLTPDKTPYITSNKDIFVGCDYLNNIVAPYELSENHDYDALIITHKVFESLTKNDLGYYILSYELNEGEMNNALINQYALILGRRCISMAGIKHTKSKRKLYIDVESSDIELSEPEKAWVVVTDESIRDLYI